MGGRPAAARLVNSLLGERYWSARRIALRAEVLVTPMPERAEFAKRFADRVGTVVRRGPFQGMQFFDWVPGRTTLVPMLLGTYEQELHPAIEAQIARGPELVVDVGCAEGYYAVGLARRLPGSRVVAFDIDGFARSMCRRLARRNGVSDRVEVRAECSTAFLCALPAGALVVSDCEGAEKLLLDPDPAPALREAHLIVELHDDVDPEISHTIRTRFAASHDIETVVTQPRDCSDYPELGSYSAADAARAISEERTGDMTWFVMRPR